jgi:hypothetical protein
MLLDKAQTRKLGVIWWKKDARDRETNKYEILYDKLRYYALDLQQTLYEHSNDFSNSAACFWMECSQKHLPVRFCTWRSLSPTVTSVYL